MYTKQSTDYGTIHVHIHGSWNLQPLPFGTWSAIGSLFSRAAAVPARTESGGKRTLHALVEGIGIIAVVRRLALCAVCSR